MKRLPVRVAAVFAGVVLSLPIGGYPATECVPVPPPEPIHHVCGTVINQLGEVQVYGEGYLDAYFSVVIVKPGTKCERALQVGLAVGMGCSGASLVKAKKLE
jgi:hypothetical protein